MSGRFCAKNYILITLITFGYLAVLIRQFISLYGKDGPFGWNTKIYVEVIVIILLCGGTFLSKISPKCKMALAGLYVLLTAWLHQTFFSLLVAATDILLIVWIGVFFCFLLKGERSYFDIFECLFLGMGTEIILVAVLSLAHRYSVKTIWFFYIFLALIGTVYLLTGNRRTELIGIFRSFTSNFDNWLDKDMFGRIFFSVLFSVFMIQLARSGIQGDYDGYWYGLRSEYVLASSEKGIYEDLGLVGFVYLYPKGAEILMLPLRIIDSWNVYFVFYNILSIFLVGMIYRFLMWMFHDSIIAGLLSSLAVSNPSLASMSMTVKPDNLTVLYQIMAIYFMYSCYKRKRKEMFWISMGALVGSYCFKLTALLFSSSILLGMIPFLLAIIKNNKPSLKGGYHAVIGFLMLFAVWGRNVILTGVPLIAYINPLIEKLGIQVKYPYALMKNVNDLSETGSFVHKVGRRIINYFLVPTNESHILIAWGTFLPLMIILTSIVFFLFSKRLLSKWLWFMSFILVSMLYAMGTVIQADGNYLILHYILVIIIGGGFLLYYSKGFCVLLSVGLVFQLMLMPLVAWSWPLGFSDISFKLAESSSRNNVLNVFRDIYGDDIYNTLTSNPNCKVVLLGNNVVDLCGIPAISESSYDIVVSNGKLLEEPTAFELYISNGYINYILASESDIDSNTIILLRELIEDGFVNNMRINQDDGEHWLLELDADGTVDEENIKRVLEKYDTRKGEVHINYGLHNDAWAEPSVSFEVYSKDGHVEMMFDEPLELDKEMQLNIFLGSERKKKLKLNTNSVINDISIDVPKNKYVEIRLEADDSVLMGDGRMCSYRMWVNP